MVGNGLKKLAKEHGMTVSNGIAYGSLGGYAATLTEGSGWKRIVFSTTFADPEGRVSFTDAVNARNLRKEFRITGFAVDANLIVINFHDNPGTMGKLRKFLEWILPMLQQYGASGVDICGYCGIAAEDGCWVMVNGVAHRLHRSCAESLRQEVQASNEQRQMEDTGNYVSGFLGALAGSVLGAIVWAVVLSIGYIASIVGLLIGFLAQKGYDLCKGRQGKAKVAILIFSVIFGVVLGNIAADVITILTLMQAGELPGMVVGDIPWLMLTVWMDDPEYRAGVVKNILMGILFAGLGVFGLLRQTGKSVSGASFTELK